MRALSCLSMCRLNGSISWLVVLRFGRTYYFYTGLSKWSRECTYVQVFTEIVHAVGTINTAGREDGCKHWALGIWKL